MKEPKEERVQLRGRAMAQYVMALENTFPQVLEGQLTLISSRVGIFTYLNPKTGAMEAISIRVDM